VCFTAVDVTAIGIIVGIIGIIVGIVVGISGIIFETIKLRREKQREKILMNPTIMEPNPPFTYKKIQVRPSKSIADCSIRYNGKLLLCLDNGKYAKQILEGGTALYQIPAGEENDNAKVVFFDGKKVLLRTILKDIHG